jgi:hypothetical protein
VDVLLDNAGAPLLFRGLFHNLTNFSHVLTHRDALTLVCVFAWLYDPGFSFELCFKLQKFWIIQTRPDQKGDRQRMKWVLTQALIVGTHIQKQGLFVR